MDFELRRAREKLEKEQRARKENARLKFERERKSKQEAATHREAIEAVHRARRLAAVEAEAKAVQQAEENLLAGRGVNFSRVLQAIPYQGSGDKIKLPPSCFNELSAQGAFEKGPLHFSLTLMYQESTSENGGKDSSRTTHAGVLEFTAEEGFVALPSHCLNNLFLTEFSQSMMVEVRYVWLPKGTYAKLQSDESGFSDIPNNKAVLETCLRHHATISQGDVLTVNQGILTYHLRVLELKPSSSVSVLETDIEVDIMGPETPERGNETALKLLTFEKPESGLVEEGNYNYFKFSIDDETWNRISSNSVNIVVKLESLSPEGDTDLYLSKHPNIFPTRHQHLWSSHDVGSKILVLSSQDHKLGPGTYSVAVYGFKGASNFLLSVIIQEVSPQLPHYASSLSSSSDEVDAVECRNCKRFVPSRTIVLHEAYCSRHNVVCEHPSCGVVLRIHEVESHVHCEKCGQAFGKGEIEKHMKVFHEPLHCPCGIVLEKDQMVQHQSSECPLRFILCQFCGDMVKAGTSAADIRDRMRGLSEHESICGSRTAPCDSCGRSVMLKDMNIHQVAVHQKN